MLTPARDEPRNHGGRVGEDQAHVQGLPDQDRLVRGDHHRHGRPTEPLPRRGCDLSPAGDDARHLDDRGRALRHLDRSEFQRRARRAGTSDQDHERQAQGLPRPQRRALDGGAEAARGGPAQHRRRRGSDGRPAPRRAVEPGSHRDLRRLAGRRQGPGRSPTCSRTRPCTRRSRARRPPAAGRSRQARSGSLATTKEGTSATIAVRSHRWSPRTTPCWGWFSSSRT